MLAIRDQTLAWLEAHASPLVVVTNVAPGTAEYFREITGTVTVPYFMDQPGSGALLHRDSSGNVAQNGTVDVPFRIVVPNSVRTHGDMRAESHSVTDFREHRGDGRAARAHASFFARRRRVRHRLVGNVTETDRGTVVGLISSTPSQLGTLTDRVHQAMANWLVMTRAMKRLRSRAKSRCIARSSATASRSCRTEKTTAGRSSTTRATFNISARASAEFSAA